MKYQAGSRRRAAVYEREIARWWQDNKVFEKSVSARPADDAYVFYDGPPFITGNPHHGTLLSSIVKDAVPRFWTMRGKRCERRWGWDCHGLPAENFVEKQLGITDRRDIGTKWSLEEYITKARESMVANSETWESTITRIGRWVDFKGAYRTMDKDFMESVWWAFKTLYEKGKIYEGRKVLMYDTKFATPVSKAEVTMDNDAYQTVTDPSAYVKFKVLAKGDNPLSGELADSFLLAWTTTPWTLPANLALAVNAELEYGVFKGKNGEQLILTTTAAKRLFPEQKANKIFKGKQLKSLTYAPIIENLPDGAQHRDTYTVLVADFVTDEGGTGVVHCAPAYGEDDYALMQDYDLDFVDVIDANGYYLPEMAAKLHALGVRDTDESGIEIWTGNKFIAKCLEAEQIIYAIEYIQHEYPFNPRSKQRIMYRAFPSWFFDIQGSKPLLLTENENVNWFPVHLKHGRFAKNIEQAPDWNLSRDRFWATAMPVWKGDKGSVRVVGSYDELYELSGVRLEDYHRPWVDAIEFDIDGEHFKRIDKVLDCWFESGSMPFAQLHYPFENKEKFEANYPADFIVEYMGQVRAWFYYVHVVNTALFGRNAYKNVITTGTLAGNDGRKMSKSLGNYTDPNELMDKFSADSLRFLLLSSPVLSGEDFALIDKDVSDVARKLTGIWNVFDFFTTYAAVDGFESPTSLAVVRDFSDFKNPLDIWIISEMHNLRNHITAGMEQYNLPDALSTVLPFLDDLSNWFVRRSRRRFWKSEDSADKAEAYRTLSYVLVYLSQILAPFVPFLAEELYQQMTGAAQLSAAKREELHLPESVHLCDWPEAGAIDAQVQSQMTRTRDLIAESLALRMRRSEGEPQIKIRQPLARLAYTIEAPLESAYEQMLLDEVNVKQVNYLDAQQFADFAQQPGVASSEVASFKVALDKTITPELAREGFARELIRVVQAARKKAGLDVSDRIKLRLSWAGQSESTPVVPPEHQETLQREVLATEFTTDGNYTYDEIAKVEGKEVLVSLEKA